MGTPMPAGVGPLESEVLAALWLAGEPLPVRGVLERLNRARPGNELAYTTVMTVLVRLAEKGYLRREAHGRGYRYEPVAADAAGLAVKEVLREHGEAAVAHFVAEAQADPALRRRLARFLRNSGETRSS